MGLVSWYFSPFGKLAPELRTELESEGVLVLEESSRRSIMYRNYHAPGRHSAYARRGVVLMADRRGTVEVRVSSPQAQRFVELIAELQAAA
jgi:hypothetical protein